MAKGELLSITKMDAEELKLFITIFRPFLMNFNGLWMIKNDTFKTSILEKYELDQVKTNEKIA